MRKWNVGAMVVLGLALVMTVEARAQEGFTADPLDKVKAELQAKKAVLVDVREPREWNQGHLEGAVLLPLSRLKEWERDGVSKADAEWLTRTLPRGTVVYCHCAFGGRALTAGETLRDMKYDARPLKQGYADLLKAGFPKSKTAE